MFDVEVKTDGFKRACAEFFAGLEHAASDAVVVGSRAAEAEARAIIRRTTKRRTGELENNTLSYQYSSREAHFISSSKHARFIDGGTQPHIIAARNAEFLRFERNGVVYFRRFVHHPGTAPRPFVRQATVVGELAMRLEAERGVDRLASKFNRN